MSSPFNLPGESAPKPVSQPQSLWQRISEGREIDELWRQFSADAKASYGFYGRDIDWDEINKLPWYHRPLHIAPRIFWALLMKLSPARRLILLIAIAMLLVSSVKLHFGNKFTLDYNFDLVAALLFLLLLSLELADKVTMKRDLEIAREIQLWLVPASPPQVPEADIAFATRPQNSVAGDYYDAFFPSPGEQNRLMLVIADVAGKSVPAALLMATLQASLRTIAGEGASLSELVIRLNRYACAHSLGGLCFTTAVVAEYEVSARRLSYVNAGHNAPIVRRRNSEMEELTIGGVPLGINPDSRYETATLDLHPGDALIFFTDGVVEAFSEAGEEFGNTRLAETVRRLPECSAQDSLQFLMKRVDEFVGTTRQSDDITCMIFRSV